VFLRSTPYPFPSGNTNERTIRSLSVNADALMRSSDGESYFDIFQKFFDYYDKADYADLWISAAFDVTSTGFANGNADFGVYGEDFNALQGKFSVIEVREPCEFCEIIRTL
jgi:hypothetical protein